MEVVICKLTLEALDSELEGYLRMKLPTAKIVVAKCIGCCGECTTSYTALKDGQLVARASREELLKELTR